MKRFSFTIVLFLIGASLSMAAPTNLTAQKGKNKLVTHSYSVAAEAQASFADAKKAASVDVYGVRHERHAQIYRGLPVFGGEMIIHTDKKGMVSKTGRIAHIKGLKVKPSLSRDDAMAAGARQVSGASFKANLAVYPLAGGARLVWHLSEQAMGSQWQLFVDAHSGEIVNSYNNIMNGTGTGVLGDSKTVDTTFNGSVYEMLASDNSRITYTANNRKRLPGTLMTDSDDVWTDGAAVDAHHYAGLVLNYYSSVYGRSSFDDMGAQIISSVHYERDLVNAYWNGTQMIYGDGDGVNSLALSGAFDVVAHEITHAVTSSTSDLIYQNESGALNEAFSDIMGAAAEFAMQPAIADWWLGEDIWLADDALRYMDDPTRDGYSVDHYSNLITGSADNGGVHGNSGIANLAFYLTSDGGTHPTNGGSYTGVGLSVAEQIYFTAFTEYLTPSATFEDARAACELVALNYSAAIQDSVSAAWEGVGVGVAPPPGGDEIVLSVGESFSSDHPYANNEDITWTYTNPGASSVRVDFSYIDMERNYDYIYILDGANNIVGSATGKYANGAYAIVQGDTLKVNMVTDVSITKYGFDGVVN